MVSSTPTPERAAELRANLTFVKAQIIKAVSDSNLPHHHLQLIAVSSEWPVQDMRVLYDAGHRHFGEHRVDQMREKASALPSDIRWHFIGTQLEGKGLAEISNLHAVQRITSQKAADELNNALSPGAPRHRLRVYIQVNTSSEAKKEGLEPLLLGGGPVAPESQLEQTPPALQDTTIAPQDTPLAKLALHIVTNCPRLWLTAIGSSAESVKAGVAMELNSGNAAPNADLETLKVTRTALEGALLAAGVSPWGKDIPPSVDGSSCDNCVPPEGSGVCPDRAKGPLLLGMGTSMDYVAAIHAGSNVLRVGTAIFGARPPRVVEGG
ncbi:hypothetical protein BJ138DRAFT_1183072 [Hygrophoropsis aurantiaca]|uniref:Uncharacterized protein n=1 Tax=Hygrophoropsis aurantiaca TaxID=72124 RepID=A0ACB8A0B6_9AGAM|nr:hypothetical protein BJ138DRAFT_1183072 [Hygrophoropsis aurantiaca]